MSLTTVHWYKATRENGDSVDTLLDEEPLRTDMANLKQLVDISNRWEHVPHTSSGVGKLCAMILRISCCGGSNRGHEG